MASSWVKERSRPGGFLPSNDLERITLTYFTYSTICSNLQESERQGLCGKERSEKLLTVLQQGGMNSMFDEYSE